MVAQQQLEGVLSELDIILGTRLSTMSFLVSQYVSLIIEEQISSPCLAGCSDVGDMFDLWVAYRRAIRKVPGYEIERVAEGDEKDLVWSIAVPPKPEASILKPDFDNFKARNRLWNPILKHSRATEARLNAVKIG